MSDAGTICLAKRGDGQSCTKGFLEEETCTNGCFEHADGGLRCGPLSLGDQCLEPAACGADSFCAGLARACSFGCTVVTPGACAQRIDLGQACTNLIEDDGCRGGICLAGTCRTVAPGTLAAGSVCDAVDQCSNGLFCNGLATPPTDGGVASGVCAARLITGTTCSLVPPNYDDPCTSGSHCKNGVCVSLKGVTEPCLDVTDCRNYLDCFKPTGRDAGVCRLPADAGAACGKIDFVGNTNFGVSCGTVANPRAFCNEAPDAGFVLSGGVSSPPRVAGSACTFGGQCEPQRCHMGVCAAVCM